MIGKIDNDGALHLLRRGTWTMQTCPHMAPTEEEAWNCDDNCPAFMETNGTVALNCMPQLTRHEVRFDERGQGTDGAEL